MPGKPLHVPYVQENCPVPKDGGLFKFRSIPCDAQQRSTLQDGPLVGGLVTYERRIITAQHITPFHQTHPPRVGRESCKDLMFRGGIPGCTDYPAEWVRSHIIAWEKFSLFTGGGSHLVEARPDFLRANTITMDVDNKTMLYGVQKGRVLHELMLNLFRTLFWLQVHANFTLKLRWISPGRKLGSGQPD